MNLRKELEKNIRWIALKSGKTNKQVLNDIKQFEKFFLKTTKGQKRND